MLSRLASSSRKAFTSVHARRLLPGVKSVLSFSTAQQLPPDISNQRCEFDTFIFDVDGVILQGGGLIPGVKEALEHLQQHGKQIYFVSNNSTKSRRVYAEKFQSLGLVRVAEKVVLFVLFTVDTILRN